MIRTQAGGIVRFLRNGHRVPDYGWPDDLNPVTLPVRFVSVQNEQALSGT